MAGEDGGQAPNMKPGQREHKARRQSIPFEQSARRMLRSVREAIGPAAYAELVGALQSTVLPWLMPSVDAKQRRITPHNLGCRTLALLWRLNRAMLLNPRGLTTLVRDYKADRCTLRRGVSHIDGELAKLTLAKQPRERRLTDE